MFGNLKRQNMNRFNIPESFETPYEKFTIPIVYGRMLIFADTHIPYHNIPSLNAMFSYSIKNKIKSILINGDLIDQHSLSKFLIDPRKRNFKQEIETTREFILNLKEVFPRAKIYVKLGNHDIRFEHFLMRKAPELLGFEEFKLSNILHTYALGIEMIEDNRIVYLGKLPILHGHEINMRGTTVNPARTLYLKVKTSCMCAHLHTSSQHTEKRLDGHMISTWSIGHMCEEHPAYAPINNWNPGFAIVDYDAEFFEVSNYKVIDGRVYRS